MKSVCSLCCVVASHLQLLILFGFGDVLLCYTINEQIVNLSRVHILKYFYYSCTDFESPKASRQCYGGVSRHLTKVTELKSESESNGKVFLHLNAGGMLGGYIWYPILGAGPAVESIKTLNYNAVVTIYTECLIFRTYSNTLLLSLT